MKESSIKIHPINKNDHSPLEKEVGQLALDIYHTYENIVIVAPVAGVKESDVKVSLTEDVLVIQGERHLKEEVKEENYYTKECFWGKFSRAIVLPKEADTSQISASFEHNILQIRIGKKANSGTQIIKIKAQNEQD